MPNKLRKLALLLAALVSYSASGLAATPIGSVTITGAEQSSGGVWDAGTVTATFNGVSVSYMYNQFSSPATIAAALGALLTNACAMPVYAQANGATLTFYKKGTSTVSAASIVSSSNILPSSSFSINMGSAWSIPLVTGVSLPQGPPGMGLVITGSGFTGSSQVFIGGATGGAQAPIIGNPSSTQIIVQVPNGIGLSSLVVVVNGYESNDYPFQIVSPFGCN